MYFFELLVEAKSACLHVFRSGCCLFPRVCQTLIEQVVFVQLIGVRCLDRSRRIFRPASPLGFVTEKNTNHSAKGGY